jgi:hypothetical protein
MVIAAAALLVGALLVGLWFALRARSAAAARARKVAHATALAQRAAALRAQVEELAAQRLAADIAKAAAIAKARADAAALLAAEQVAHGVPPSGTDADSGRAAVGNRGATARFRAELVDWTAQVVAQGAAQPAPPIRRR